LTSSSSGHPKTRRLSFLFFLRLVDSRALQAFPPWYEFSWSMPPFSCGRALFAFWFAVANPVLLLLPKFILGEDRLLFYSSVISFFSLGRFVLFGFVFFFRVVLCFGTPGLVFFLFFSPPPPKKNPFSLPHHFSLSPAPTQSGGNLH